MFPSGIFDNQTKHHQSYDFVGGVKETNSVINEGVILHSHVYYEKMHIAMYTLAMAMLGLSPRRGYDNSSVTKEFNTHSTYAIGTTVTARSIVPPKPVVK